MHKLAEVIFDWLDHYPVTRYTTQGRVIERIQRKFNITDDFAAMYLNLWFESIEARD